MLTLDVFSRLLRVRRNRPNSRQGCSYQTWMQLVPPRDRSCENNRRAGSAGVPACPFEIKVRLGKACRRGRLRSQHDDYFHSFGSEVVLTSSNLKNRMLDTCRVAQYSLCRVMSTASTYFPQHKRVHD